MDTHQLNQQREKAALYEKQLREAETGKSDGNAITETVTEMQTTPARQLLDNIYEKQEAYSAYGVNSGAIGSTGPYVPDDGHLRQSALELAVQLGRGHPHFSAVVDAAQAFLTFLRPRQIPQPELTPKS